MKTTKSYNVQVWVGLRAGYTDVISDLTVVRKICDNWINVRKDCITITPTEFRYVKGWEPGYVIGFINYPRFPQETSEILARAIALGRLLKDELKQNRITVTAPDITYMIEDEQEQN